MQRIIATDAGDASWLAISVDIAPAKTTALEFFVTEMKTTLLEMWNNDAEMVAEIESLINNASPSDVETDVAKTRTTTILGYFSKFKLNGKPTDRPNILIKPTDKLTCYFNQWDMFVLVIANKQANTLFVWETTA